MGNGDKTHDPPYNNVSSKFVWKNWRQRREKVEGRDEVVHDDCGQTKHAIRQRRFTC